MGGKPSFDDNYGVLHQCYGILVDRYCFVIEVGVYV